MSVSTYSHQGAAALDLLARGRVRSAGAAVFAYHDVGSDARHFTPYSVSAGRLRQQVGAAQRWGLRFVPLSDLVTRLRAGDDVGGLAAVTFDDAIGGVFHHAAGILADLGVGATVFAVSDELGGATGWWEGSADTMTAAQLCELAELGWEVGSHGRTHATLPGLSDHALLAEVVSSRRRLEDLVQRPVDLFAYPFGHHDPRVRSLVAEAGYRAGFAFRNGRVTAELDPYRLPRFTMHQGLNRVRLAYQLAREPAEWPNTQLEFVSHRI